MKNNAAQQLPQSFAVNHDCIEPGLYIARVDGSVTTYELRTRKPNAGAYMSNCTMHSVEHMLATYIRQAPLGRQVLYFGPMGCQTGFCLLMDAVEPSAVRALVITALAQVIAHDGPVFGASRQACGNYKTLSLRAAKAECRRYLAVLQQAGEHFAYTPKQP